MNKPFQGKKVLIMGLGLHGGGVAVAQFFCAQGAEVLVTDLKNEEKLKESLDKLAGLSIKYSLGGHKEADFTWPNLIIKNPDVPSTSPYLEIARKNNIEIESDINLFLKLASKVKGLKVVGVTGTKGKSTTASLIYHLLKAKHKNVFLAGNIGISPLEVLGRLKRNSIVVLELSNFELEDMSQSPNIAVVTNIMADHLNRYATMADYVNAKKLIFKYQNQNDFLVLNADDSIVRQFTKEAKSTVLYFSIKNQPKGINPKNFKLLGTHNLTNLFAAIEVARILNVSNGKIEDSLESFEGVSSRQEFVREVGGVKYFNDTTATMPDAASTAINTFSESFPNSKIILICGGQDKGLDYSKFASEIRKKVQNVIMLPGTASDKIKALLEDYLGLKEVSSMQEAVTLAREISENSDIVLLSPAAASFNLFKNEFDRGNKFIEAVKNLK